MTVTIHEITFARHPFSGTWRATCTCGQCKTGKEFEIKSWGAVHDLNSEDKPFVSGLESVEQI